MLINIMFSNFSLLAFDEKKLPFAMLNLHAMKIFVKKGTHNHIEVETPDLNGSYFENFEDKDLVERKMLGELDVINRYDLKELQTDEKVVDKIIENLKDYTEELDQKFQGIDKEMKKEKLRMAVTLDMYPTGDKVISVNLNSLKVFLITSIYLKLLAFVKMDDSVYPPPPKRAAAKALSSVGIEIAEKVEYQASMFVSVNMKNIIITMPSSKTGGNFSPSVLAIRGDINLIYDYHPPLPVDTLKEQLKSVKAKKGTDYCADENLSAKIQVTIKDLEIFICALKALMSTENFKEVRKRNVILPFSLVLIRKTHAVLNKN